MKQLYFPYPFSFFRGLDFTNCFASLYMYLEKVPGRNDHDCAHYKNEPCDGCRRCDGSLQEKQERLFFLFDTVSGRSATIWGYGDKPTTIYTDIYDNDDMVDFVAGYAGYSFTKYTDGFTDLVHASINNDIPVLARMKDACHGSFRVITGYEGNSLLLAEPIGAQNKSGSSLSVDEIDSVYIFGEKIDRKYTLIDGLKRIKYVMDCNQEAKTWDDYINAFKNYWGELKNVDLDEIKQRFWYAQKAMMFNCHNFSEVFRIYKCDYSDKIYFNSIWDEWKILRNNPACAQIDSAYDDSHKRQWQVAALYGTRDWSKRFYNEWEWGMCENAVDALSIVKHDDEIVYSAVCELIGIVEENSHDKL
ncbi:MAG: hypothetical protein ACYCYI_00370 [Saccharofermentanales bacterium]